MHNHLYALHAGITSLCGFLAKVRQGQRLLLIGLCVLLCVLLALLFLPKFYSLLEFVVPIFVVFSSRIFEIFTHGCVCIRFCLMGGKMTHSIQICLIYALLNLLFFLLYRRHASQFVTVQSPSWSSEALAFSLRANGKRRGSNRACSCTQQVHGLFLATSRFEQ